jgi:hypothetical protein
VPQEGFEPPTPSLRIISSSPDVARELPKELPFSLAYPETLPH